MTTQQNRFDTLAIHAGQHPDPTTGDAIPAIHVTSTYTQDGIGGLRGGYEYSRGGNPTRTALEEQLAAIEGGAAGISFASGLAAEDALLRAVVSPGDHVLVPNDVYGGTHRLVRTIHGKAGVAHSTVDTADLDAVRAAVRPESRVLWVETPSNPLMKISDIPALAQLAHEHDLLLVVDNTFASPALQRPLDLGADVVVHSTTKYLGGHSDVVGGAVVVGHGRDGKGGEELAEQVRYVQFAAGAVSSPFDAFLTTRGIKTLAVRMQRHSENAQVLAERLVHHPAVARVLYPGLPDHPGHKVAAHQMSRFGGMISLDLAGGEAAARAFAESTHVFLLAESLGGVESLVNYPSAMTHASVRGTEAEVPPSIVRLSVGLEDVTDLLEDVEQALDRV
ncbi:cystathionine gamma-synthase [Promicromonospora citrea]|uniref:Cystathionine gamma-synthase n=1 Tax=Promicromonospora citrea TaxID=43677 RepID=A0A8H9GHJ3_9MICO|nr:cystathionine gamma-synthase [Promicromonospora citrea]NNH52353.1 cystathionine gamma-synthase [Promicromonospora citrea]GGM23836.1 cystathionine gamma-synthase [Promicromonospora citrea]